MYPDDMDVQTRFPLTDEQKQDRDSWPWLPARIVSQVGPDEWDVLIYERMLATREDGSLPGDDDPDEDLLFPLAFRDASEIRPA